MKAKANTAFSHGRNPDFRPCAAAQAASYVATVLRLKTPEGTLVIETCGTATNFDTVVTVRGRVQVRDGQFVGDRKLGRLLRRDPVDPI